MGYCVLSLFLHKYEFLYAEIQDRLTVDLESDGLKGVLVVNSQTSFELTDITSFELVFNFLPAYIFRTVSSHLRHSLLQPIKNSCYTIGYKDMNETYILHTLWR